MSELVNPTVARPFGNSGSVGWELFTNSYPQGGPGHWVQFLAETKSFDPSWVFELTK